MPEEGPAGRVDAVGAAAEINAVKVELQDLVLAELSFERQCQHRFLHLSAEGPAIGQEDVASELLGNGRSALLPVTGRQPHLEGPRNADGIDTDVAAKTL